MRQRRRLKRVTTRIAPEIQRALKKLSRIERVPMERMIADALVAFLKEHTHASA
jgi:hypothetical protein